METTPMLRPMGLGELLDASFRLYRHLFVPMVFVSIVTQALPLALNVFVEAGGGLFAHPVAYLFAVLTAVVMGQIGIAASTFLVAEAYRGRSLTPRDAFVKARPFVGRLISAAMASGLVIFIGLIFLLVPGIILMCGLAIAAPALVLENQPTGTAGMRRSWQLTEGYRGKIFVAYLVAFLFISLPGIALGAFTVVASDGGSIAIGAAVFLAVQLLLQILAYPFLYVLTTLMYYDFRVRKEAYDLEELAASLSSS